MRGSLAWVPGLWGQLAALKAGDRVELVDGFGKRFTFTVVARCWSQRHGITAVAVKRVRGTETFLATKDGWEEHDARSVA